MLTMVSTTVRLMRLKACFKDISFIGDLIVQLWLLLTGAERHCFDLSLGIANMRGAPVDFQMHESVRLSA